MRHSHHRRHSPWGPRHRRAAHSLRRRIFTWFGVTIAMTSLVVWGTLTFFGGGPQWNSELKKAKAYVAGNYAVVWADPAAREELTRRTERDLQIRIRLFDPSGVPLQTPSTETPSGPRETKWCKDPFRVAVRDLKDARSLGTIEACFASPPERSARFLTTLFFALLSVWTAAGFLARRIAKPYLAIGRAAERFGSGDLTTRMDESNTSLEARQVAGAFNAMASQIEKQIADRKALLATVSHEIRTPLARMQFLLERLFGQDPSSKREPQELLSLREELLGLNSLVEDLLASSRIEMGKGDWKEFEVVDLVLRVMEDLEVDLGLLSVEAPNGQEADHSPKILMGDPTLVRRAVVNLLSNAVAHANNIVGIRVRFSPDEVVFTVEDEGPGLSENDLKHVFDAFYKNPKAEGQTSTGMGLHIVERVATLHRGRVSAENRRDGKGAVIGAKFVFVLSRAAGKVTHAESPRDAAREEEAAHNTSEGCAR